MFSKSHIESIATLRRSLFCIIIYFLNYRPCSNHTFEEDSTLGSI